MRYAYFRSLGLCVGSGVVESGCKVVIALRCSLFSHTFDDFWSRFRANNYMGTQKVFLS